MLLPAAPGGEPAATVGQGVPACLTIALGHRCLERHHTGTAAHPDARPGGSGARPASRPRPVPMTSPTPRPARSSLRGVRPDPPHWLGQRRYLVSTAPLIEALLE